MANKIMQLLLLISALLIIAIFFLYRGNNWPLGTQEIEAIGAFAIILFALFSQPFFSRKIKTDYYAQEKTVLFGLLIGFLWTLEINMNNILMPGIPARDIYDNIFWGFIALVIFIIALISSYKTKKITSGISTGFWTGFASGSVACVTGLIFIVFGMSQLLHDPLNIAEWSVRGPTSGTPNTAVYFAYQTLAGAILHLLVLGIAMGLLLGLLGGVLGKILPMLVKKK
jgi:hypothetical protein